MYEALFLHGRQGMREVLGQKRDNVFAMSATGVELGVNLDTDRAPEALSMGLMMES